MTATLGGVWPAMLTPLTADGQLALDAIERLTDLFARQGLGGLYVGGSTGQWVSLTLEERRALVECGRVLALMRGRYHLAVEDVQHVASSVLRHRIILNFDAHHDGQTPETILHTVIKAATASASVA